MIPKKIHYCWFGQGEKPKLAQKCIASWEKYCPDFEIIEWNEDNFDINMNGYTRMCYEQKKYAFLSDYVRLVVVAEHGGIYFDTDVELLKCPNELLKNKAFFGFEGDQYVNTGVGFGAEKGNPAVTQMLKSYDPLIQGDKGVIGCPTLNTQALEACGLKLNGKYQELPHATIYPSDYFNPYESTTGRLNKTSNTVSVHWYAGAWLSPWQRFRSTISKPLHRIFGTEFLQRFHK